MLLAANMKSPSAAGSETPARQILLIDDDRDMADMLAEYLRPEVFSVYLAHTANADLERLQKGGLVLVILDVMLPDCDGFSVLKELRHKSRIPVIMLTTRSAVTDRVSGLKGGADDYIPKPFTPVELLARIRTVLRRGQPARFSAPFLTIEDLILDAGSRTVECAVSPSNAPQRSSTSSTCWLLPRVRSYRENVLPVQRSVVYLTRAIAESTT
jgi:DNA-binding response OmpR family regulator